MAERSHLGSGLNEQGSRLARAGSGRGGDPWKLRLYGFDGGGRMAPMEWPPNWAVLRDAMPARMQGTLLRLHLAVRHREGW